MENDTIMENDSELDENKITKRTRSGGGRESMMRGVDDRTPIMFGHISRFFFHPSILADKRYEYGWSAYMIRGEEFHQSYNTARHKGWENLPPSEYPALGRNHKNDPFRRRETEHDALYESGQIAMRRKIEYKKDEDQHWAAVRASNAASINQYKTSPEPLMNNGSFRK